MARVVWARAALNHLREIDEYISQHSPERAAAVVTRLSQATRILATTPRLGRRVPEYGQDHIRELVTEKPYRIIYLVHGDECRVVAVVHGRRDLGGLYTAEDLEAN